MSKLVRPKVVKGQTYAIETGCGQLFVTINEIDNNPFEVFSTLGKAGGCAAAQCETIGRLISYGLRIGGDTQELIKQLKGVSCHERRDTSFSCADAVGRVLETYSQVANEKNDEGDV